jgi:hypothetical protein
VVEGSACARRDTLQRWGAAELIEPCGPRIVARENTAEGKKVGSFFRWGTRPSRRVTMFRPWARGEKSGDFFPLRLACKRKEVGNVGPAPGSAAWRSAARTPAAVRVGTSRVVQAAADMGGAWRGEVGRRGATARAIESFVHLLLARSSGSVQIFTLAQLVAAEGVNAHIARGPRKK